MNLKKQQELQNDLTFLKAQFEQLNTEIKRPHSLDAEMLRYKLENLDLLEAQPAKRGRSYYRAFAGVAACFVCVFGVFYAMRGIGGNLEAPAAPAPMMARAMPNETLAAPEAAMADEAAMDEAAVPDIAAYNVAPEAGAGGLTASTKMPGGEMIASIEVARESEPFGDYLPLEFPNELEFSSAYTQGDDLNVVLLNQDYSKELRITVSDFAARVENQPEMQQYVVDPAQPKMYDLRMYKIPYTESIPAEQLWITNSVIFPAQQLTESLLEARIVPIGEAGNPQLMGQVGVLFANNILVDFSVVGVAPQELYKTVTTIKAT